MSSKLPKSTSESMNLANNNDSISVRLARILDHQKHLQTNNNESFRREADTRVIQQQEFHTKELDELREQYEEQLQLNREKLENLMKTKLKAAEIASQRDKEALDHVLKTISVTHNQINESESRVTALEQVKGNLTDRVRNLQTSLKMEQFHATKLEADENQLREELASKIDQYQQLAASEAENSLGLEIAKFQHLLSAEEKRIKLSTS